MGVWNRRYKPLYVERIDKAILCSTGNCLQHPVQNHDGKESFKVCINIHQKCSELRLVVRAWPLVAVSTSSQGEEATASDTPSPDVEGLIQ